jgi:predicted nucleic acid-binding Zn finger protein
MQQLTVEHKKIPKTTSNQKVVGNEQREELVVENKREGHGRNIALTRKVFRLENSDTFYVESGSTDNVFYFIRYEPSFEYCSCLDNSVRHVRCKHIFAIEYAIKKGTLQEIEHLPTNAQRYPQKITAKDWRSDEYDF